MNLPLAIATADAIPSVLLRRVFSHWAALAGDRIGPRRSEISPVNLKFALPLLWMWDVIDGGKDFQFRLSGERIKTFIDIDVAGKRLSQLDNSLFIDEVRHVFEHCVSRRAPLIVGPMPMSYEPRRHHIVTAIVLPLSENGTDVSTLFGATEAEAMVAAKSQHALNG
jgi:hypothetical protein